MSTAHKNSRYNSQSSFTWIILRQKVWRRFPLSATFWVGFIRFACSTRVFGFLGNEPRATCRKFRIHCAAIKGKYWSRENFMSASRSFSSPNHNFLCDTCTQGCARSGKGNRYRSRGCQHPLRLGRTASCSLKNLRKKILTPRGTGVHKETGRNGTFQAEKMENTFEEAKP